MKQTSSSKSTKKKSLSKTLPYRTIKPAPTVGKIKVASIIQAVKAVAQDRKKK